MLEVVKYTDKTFFIGLFDMFQWVETFEISKVIKGEKPSFS